MAPDIYALETAFLCQTFVGESIPFKFGMARQVNIRNQPKLRNSNLLINK